jgi:hypothetical protein
MVMTEMMEGEFEVGEECKDNSALAKVGRGDKRKQNGDEFT